MSPRKRHLCSETSLTRICSCRSILRCRLFNRKHNSKAFTRDTLDTFTVEDTSRHTYLQAESLDLKTHFCTFLFSPVLSQTLSSEAAIAIPTARCAAATRCTSSTKSRASTTAIWSKPSRATVCARRTTTFPPRQRASKTTAWRLRAK